MLEPRHWYVYLAAWSMACGLGLVLAIRARARLSLFSAGYRRFLAVPWKLVTFFVAAGTVAGVARYTGDPTWDAVDGLFMSVFCFLGAPWVTGTLFGAVRGGVAWDELVVAILLWLFSASWSYDGYLVLRDGYYPPTWSSNLFASTVIYFGGGLFWSLEHRLGRGVVFSFMLEGWPERPLSSSPWRFALYALVFALPIILAVALYLL